MTIEEVPQFFLYSHGIPPAELTLGTLVFGNYAQPEGRSAVFRGTIDPSLVARQEVQGCWTAKKDSKYGLGIEALVELASIGVDYVKSRKKMVSAEEGSRLVLKDPQGFLQDHVLRSPETRAKLAQWLTAAKSTYLVRKATFRRPKIYCVTGVYELEGAHAWVERSSETSIVAGIDDISMGLTTGVPLGFRVGPFQSSTHMTCNVHVKGRQVWAARFHQLKVGYVRQGNASDTRIPSNIVLLVDATVPGEAIMGSDSPVKEKQVCEGRDSINANGADVEMASDIEEFSGEGEDEYWLAWDEAVQKLEGEAEDRLEDEEDEETPWS